MGKETTFGKINYKELNSRQKENFNFQKISAVLADYGYTTIRLTDDYKGADFIAVHIDGITFLKVQLKSGGLQFWKKYQNKEIWICFPYKKVGSYIRTTYFSKKYQVSTTSIKLNRGKMMGCITSPHQTER